MSRFVEWDGEEGFNNQSELWWANVQRALNGKRGQQVLVELYEVLKAMTVKRLISGRLANEDGEVCAVGALALHRRVNRGEDRAAVIANLASLIDEEDPNQWDGARVTAEVGVDVGLTYALAWHLAETNDEMGNVTPELRYETMLHWLEKAIKPVPVDASS